MVAFTIEVGKPYLSRDGRKVSILEKLTPEDVLFNSGYRFAGAIGKRRMCFTERGRVMFDRESQFDIVSSVDATLRLRAGGSYRTSNGKTVVIKNSAFPNIFQSNHFTLYNAQGRVVDQRGRVAGEQDKWNLVGEVNT